MLCPHFAALDEFYLLGKNDVVGSMGNKYISYRQSVSIRYAPVPVNWVPVNWDTQSDWIPVNWGTQSDWVPS